MISLSMACRAAKQKKDKKLKFEVNVLAATDYAAKSNPCRNAGQTVDDHC
jgi:hypothetical protein